MKMTMLALCFLSLALLSPADLAQYATGDPRLDVDPILKDYAQIAGYQAESLGNRDRHPFMSNIE